MKNYKAMIAVLHVFTTAAVWALLSFLVPGFNSYSWFPLVLIAFYLAVTFSTIIMAEKKVTKNKLEQKDACIKKQT